VPKIPRDISGRKLSKIMDLCWKRLIKKLGDIDQKTINQVKSIIKEMMVD